MGHADIVLEPNPYLAIDLPHVCPNTCFRLCGAFACRLVQQYEILTQTVSTKIKPLTEKNQTCSRLRRSPVVHLVHLRIH